MQRPAIWLMLVVLLLGVGLARGTRGLSNRRKVFLRGAFEKISEPARPMAPLTVVEIGPGRRLIQIGAVVLA